MHKKPNKFFSLLKNKIGDYNKSEHDKFQSELNIMYHPPFLRGG